MRLLNSPIPDDFKMINVEGEEITSPERIKNEIVKFYQSLYENFERLETVDDQSFFENIDSISAADEDKVVEPITLEELRRTLHTCADSSPGPDGIPYSVIGLLWPTFGQILMEAWNHSLRNG